MTITGCKIGLVPPNLIQFADLNVLYNNLRVDYSLATASSSNTTSPGNEEPSRAIDNNHNTKWYTTGISGDDGAGAIFLIDFGMNINATEYNYTTADDSTERDPTSWKVDVSSNNIDWYTVSIVNSATITDDRQVVTQSFSLGSICVIGDTEIIMGDFSSKLIKNLSRGDIILQDKLTNKTGIISQIIKSLNSNMIKIPTGLLNNNEDLIISSNHPIWIKENENELRVLSSNIKGVKILNETKEVYNIQFDEEGTYYANNIKIDSLSPYHRKFSLDIDKFIDISKYIKNQKILNENDKVRNKPQLIGFFDPKNNKD
jgi:hypothetical protein